MFSALCILKIHRVSTQSLCTHRPLVLAGCWEFSRSGNKMLLGKGWRKNTKCGQRCPPEHLCITHLCRIWSTMVISSLWATSAGLFVALLGFLSSRGLWLHGGRCTSAGDMTDTWCKGFSAWYQVPVVIYWFWRPLGTLSEALALLYSSLADIYVEQKNRMIGFTVAAMMA